MTDLITEARELCSKATRGPWEVKTNRHPNLNGTPWGWIEGAQGNICWSGNQSKLDAMLMSRSRTIIPELCDALEKAQEQIESVHKALDFAETQRQRSKNYTELAINNGLALGRIAVILQHDFEPLPAAPEEGEKPCRDILMLMHF